MSDTTELRCCFDGDHGPCGALADFEIKDDGADPYAGTHACIVHVGLLLGDGVSTVWPVVMTAERPS